MDTVRVLEALDRLYAEGDRQQVEHFLLSHIEECRREGDWSTELMLQNERIGMLRTQGRFPEGEQVFRETIALFREKGLAGTVPCASTLINGATLFRAAGETARALVLYGEARGIYEACLPENDFRFAGFYNNLGLAYLDQGMTEEAEEVLTKALHIIEKLPDTTQEQATAHTTLADLALELKNLPKAEEHLDQALRGFRDMEFKDPHYASYLSARARYLLMTGDAAAALDTYECALAEIERYNGRSRNYAVTCLNCALCLEKMGRTEEAKIRKAEGRSLLDS